ncbi:MAG: hypothetical protein QUV05_11810 [Phycisphaerae bacterium]|jgi:hypothetical protein|nr:hypothetical protein [Phycisphaerae bacterium]
MKRLQTLRFATLVAAALAVFASCAGCLNPELANRINGRLYPIVPGNQPFLLVRVINNTNATIDVPIVYNDGTADREFVITGLTPQVHETGLVLDWPVMRVALCDLDNPYRATIIATLPDGSISAVPFGYNALQAGVDYAAGDGIIFSLNGDVRSPAFVRVNIGYVDADRQPDSFTRADPFEAANLILLLGGF